MQEELKAYAKGYVAMFERRGIKKNVGSELAMLQRFLSGNLDVFILCVRHNGLLVGGGIFLRSGDTCYYYQGWSERLTPPVPVLHLLLWEAMRYAKRAGCAQFDLFGFSLKDQDKQLQAINDFKRWFRGTLEIYPSTAVIPLYGFLLPLIRRLGARL
jgi:lipid II:glycine glycyltransferase (peptidoglycan interpeptide bridge formation enzyme)